MLLPESSTAILSLLILSLICLGLWANTQKPIGQSRFAHYYLDFTLAAAAMLILLCFVFGQWNRNEITFLDSFLGVSYRKIAAAMLAGAVFNAGNILLSTSTSIAGMSVSFPLAYGVTIVVISVWRFFAVPTTPLVAFAGVALGLLATVLAARAYNLRLPFESKQEAAKAAPSGSARRSVTPRKSGWKVVLASTFGGLLLGAVLPLFDFAKDGPLGIPSYIFLFFMAVGLLVSSLVLVPGFMFFPMEGDPGRIKDFLRMTVKAHLLGWSGGTAWAIGATALFIALGVPKDVFSGTSATLFLSLAAPILAGLSGLLLQQEYKLAGGAARAQAFASVGVLAAAIAFVAFGSRVA